MAAADKPAVLLVGHGSRDPEGNREFAGLVDRIRSRFSGRRVEGAFLELARPEIPETLDRLASEGVREVWAVPVILLPARHVREEIPEILAESARRLGLRVRYGRPLGSHPALLAVLEDRLREVGGAASETAVVLVGRGSSRREANADFYRLTRLFWEQTGVAWVEPCFAGITFPDVPTALERAAGAGLRRVAVVPYLLFTGVLMNRIRDWVEAARRAHPGVSFHVGRYLAGHPLLEEVVAGRIEELGGRRESQWAELSWSDSVPETKII
ncbi:MAG: sirohydrochlorin chelatase [Alicyclobacillaceae bacterium]|nr:sirohydrochlorin chelatase [Alicyclobacillaceae bacterium]